MFSGFVLHKNLGLREYDHDGRKAAALEDAIGIKVIRHSRFLTRRFYRHVNVETSSLILQNFA